MSKPRVMCPACGQRATTTKTMYGWHSKCCAGESWGSKPLVPKEVLRLRSQFHTEFDLFQWRAGMRRGDVYKWLALASGLPESECHAGPQKDAAILRRLIEILRGAG